MTFNQKLLLFLPRVDSFWADLAGSATVFIMVIFSAIHSHVIQFDGAWGVPAAAGDLRRGSRARSPRSE